MPFTAGPLSLERRPPSIGNNNFAITPMGKVRPSALAIAKANVTGLNRSSISSTMIALNVLAC